MVYKLKKERKRENFKLLKDLGEKENLEQRSMSSALGAVSSSRPKISIVQLPLS